MRSIIVKSAIKRPVPTGFAETRYVKEAMTSDPHVFEDFDMIIPSPTFIGAEAGTTDHTAEVLRRARVEDDSWPYRFDIMSKTRKTDRLAGIRAFKDRAILAETQIGPALRVDKPKAVAGKAVLVYDDVFTDGLTLREVARKLNTAGARLVAGLALARQPFRM